MRILGIRSGHDASASLVIDGRIVADAAEERFTRVKNDASFPLNAAEYCLKMGGLDSTDLDAVVVPDSGLPIELPAFFDIPKSVELELPGKGSRRWSKWFERVRQGQSVEEQAEVYHPVPEGAPVLPLYQKPWPLSPNCRVVTVEHHLAHAASAAYTSGLHGERALVATLDGIGDNVSAALWRFEDNRLTNLVSYDGSGSLGWFYGNATEALHWRHGSDEWKLMGLAPYGKPHPGALRGFHPEYEDGRLSRPHDFGEFGNWKDHGACHWHGADAQALSKIAADLGREDFSAEVQRAVEEEAFKLVLPWLEKERTRHLLCAGGFFLNVKLNQRLWYTNRLDTQWVYPNPSDGGLAAGAALWLHYTAHPEARHERVGDVYWGPEFSDDEIAEILRHRGIPFTTHDDPSAIAAEYLRRNLTVAWFQGRMEAGPRALGNRSILMSPLEQGNKDLINAKIKYREPFRPFCPSMTAEAADRYLVSPRTEEYMTCSFDVQPEKQDSIPAVVHVDKTARPQMVRREANPRYYDLIQRFGELTGEPVVLNTSFNVKGEPIVLNPRHALKCFYDTGLDVLVMGRHVVTKAHVDSGAKR